MEESYIHQDLEAEKYKAYLKDLGQLEEKFGKNNRQ